MSLAPGTKLDGYEIHALLGAGGMGEVYRARDPALKREVAVKILPSFVSRDPDRLLRFEQEAQAAAALDHPNILSVHRFGVFEGTPYLVSELLVGESLRQILQRGPLPVRKAVDYAIQIAHGLWAAHEKGIVHRDLKPENLFVTKDGRMKILDFGLAKLIRGQTESGGNAPTAPHQTDPGVVVGTAGYMSPEQVRGHAIDHRTDLFALGAILYEMLSGRRAFQRSTSAETMTAILHEDPPAIVQTGANIPPSLQRVVNRCLEKNPEQRFHSASDLAFALDALSDSGPNPAPAPPRRSAGRALVWSTGLATAMALAVMVWFGIAHQNRDAPLRISKYTQLTYNGHAGFLAGTDGDRIYLTTLVGASISQVSASGGEIEPVTSITLPIPDLVDVSPDGSTLLVMSEKKGVSDPAPLYTVQVVGGAHRYLADAVSAAWSPDGKTVAYSTPDGDLNVINSNGSGAHKLAFVGGVAHPISWSPDGGTIRFSRDNYRAIWEISSNGSNLHPFLTDWQPSESKCCGRWSPSGEFYAFLGPGPAGPESQIYALDERRRLFRRPAKEPFPLTSDPIDWDPPFFSKDGKKIFATGATHAGELDRFDLKSNQFQPYLGGISADLVAFSRDGQSVAYVSYRDDILWRANRDGSDRVQLTSPPLQPISLDWSPDGTQLVFTATSPQAREQAWIVRAKGGTPERLLPEDGGQEVDPSWSPDGRTIVFATGVGESSNQQSSFLRILDLASHQISTLPGSAGMFSPHWSPDGRSIKAESQDQSTLYIYEMRTQHWSALHIGIHAYAAWSSDSRSIYFFRYVDDPAILRVAVKGGEAKIVVSLKDFRFTGTLGLWFGLDPTDAPLMLRDVSTSDVYAFTLDER